jgi:ubiquinone/menaquinone biosynthesis C-methylase UbiE
MADDHTLKDSVRDFWNEKSCGEVYARGSDLKEQLAEQAAQRYRLEPIIFRFADFKSGAGKDVLEIGVGMGADHLEWAKAGPRTLTGVDLTPRAIGFTSERLAAHGYRSDLRVADAEALPFEDERFDIAYSYGVLHHSPNTARAVQEAWRVLRPGGTAKVMIYHSDSIVGGMLWARYGLMALRPGTTLREIYANHLESPGTKAFSLTQARAMFAGFSKVELTVALGPGDLLEGAVGQRHRGALLSMAKMLWPRWFIRRFLSGRGLGMLITAVK